MYNSYKLGNNENEVALYWFQPSVQNRDLYVSDYAKLYGDIIYPAIVSIDGVGPGGTLQRPWVDSSPSNGLLSTNPYAKRWGQASTSKAGDVHFYNYDCDCEDYRVYIKGRFISEFGFQSHPSFLGYQPVSEPVDWKIDSTFSEFLQRHENGNQQIYDQLSKHFTLPDISSCELESDKRYFDMYLYLADIQQGRCYETAINRWRQLKSEEDTQTMGILYWQLNDLWQGFIYYYFIILLLLFFF